ncbi:MAG: EAL domain-containing protein [Lachnospiraceae bacterium]|nr:EAL domain-containing protein [Lachnospiraceae bacterium]
MIVYYENYTPVGDVLVLAICMVFVALIHTAYINRTRNFLYLRDMIVILFIAAITDIVYHMSMNYIGEVPNFFIYFVRISFHLGLFSILWLYVLYMKAPLHLEDDVNRRLFIVATIALDLAAASEILGTLLKFGFYIDEAGQPHAGFPMFPIGYFFYVGMLLFIILRYRSRIYKQIVRGIVATACISILIMVIQQLYGQSSFTAATYLFPIFALLYLVHSNPYDIELGSVTESAFEEMITHSYEKKDELLLMSMYMHDFEGNGRKYPREIQEAVRRFSTQFFKTTTLFQISGGHMILVANTAKNPDYNERAQRMLDMFAETYPKYRLDYKIVFTKTYNKISADNDYVGFIHYLHDRMPQNSFCRARDKDVKDYLEHKYIVSELADISSRNDMNDPRVEVYCQPVWNIRNKSYDTAEALMRLKLPDLGMVFPDRFIPIAERHKYIHTLTRIILYKTCAQIRSMIDNGYRVRRISVNFSVFDLRDEDFTSTVERIIKENGVEFEQVAIEITESQNAKDFEIIKDRIGELKDFGIKFYLDDFGTGYSNFERILELPFDIIKFDRSLVLASNTDARMKEMVTHLAKMFSDMNYSVLYEGIENADDEARCIDMSARYLQGYKYSRPIPIERLTEYFEKRA